MCYTEFKRSMCTQLSLTIIFEGWESFLTRLKCVQIKNKPICAKQNISSLSTVEYLNLSRICFCRLREVLGFPFFFFFKIRPVGGSKLASKTAVHFPTSGPFQRNFDVRTRKPEEMKRFEACCFYSF